MNVDIVTQADIEALRTRLAEVEKRLEQSSRARQLPELISRPQLARLYGISEHSIRKSEYQRSLPGGGKFDLVACGVRYWRRETIEGWLRGFGD